MPKKLLPSPPVAVAIRFVDVALQGQLRLRELLTRRSEPRRIVVIDTNDPTMRTSLG